MQILVKAYAGSHLFGTNTPNSDLDYKGIYIPTKRDMLLNQVESSVTIKRDKGHGERNTKDDVDVEFYSFQKFMQMLHEGQTVALELLWTPDHLIIEAHPWWYDFRDFGRKAFMHKKVTSFVGYCKKQADKYGVKGSRMAAMKIAKTTCEELRQTTKLKVQWETLQERLKDVEHIRFDVQETKLGPVRYMEVCERKHQDTQTWEYTINHLRDTYNAYGARAKQAEANEGIDWKALSHAYRVCCQAIEILRDQTLTLPLKKEDLIIVRNVKLGLIPFNIFKPFLEAKLEEVLKWEKESTLPEDFDYEKWCERLVVKVYEELA
jgi:predicted nucleotidyltransferase